MEVTFRNYRNFQSTFFNLVSGDTEVKQTIGLSLTLSKDSHFLSNFLNHEKLRKTIGQIKLENYTQVIINSEFPLEKNLRADIVLKFYKNFKPDFIILFEAKSTKIESNFNLINQQLESYIEKNKDTTLSGFKIFKGIITRNEFFDKDFITITWNDIIDLLLNFKFKTELAKDYLYFLTNIRGAMKFYEKEVYSIPAGDSYEFQEKEPHIYECPNYGNFIMKKKPLYLAFRGKGGFMNKLFGLEMKITLNPLQDLDDFYNSDDYSEDIKHRIKTYTQSFWGTNLPNEKHQFFILSKTNQIELKHSPKPPKNNAFRAYYKLSDLLNGTLKIVYPEK